MNRSWSRSSLVVTLMIALSSVSLVVSLLLVSRQSTAQASPATTLTLAPVGAVRAGEPIRLRLVVAGARNLAGFQAAVAFDSPQVRILDAAAVEGLRGSGRGLLRFGPVLRENVVIFGAATCPVEDCSTAQYRSAARRPLGVNGRVELGEIVLDIAAPGRYNVRIDDVKLVDPQGNPLPAATANLTLDVK
jgi:hypothetical protein